MGPSLDIILELLNTFYNQVFAWSSVEVSWLWKVLVGVRTQFELLAKNGQSPPLSPLVVHKTLQVFQLTGAALCNAFQ